MSSPMMPPAHAVSSTAQQQQHQQQQFVHDADIVARLAAADYTTEAEDELEPLSYNSRPLLTRQTSKNRVAQWTTAASHFGHLDDGSGVEIMHEDYGVSSF